MAKNSEYRMAIKIAGEIEKSLFNCTDLTRKELNKIAREAARASTATRESFSQRLKEAEPLFEGMENVAVRSFQAVASAAAAAGITITGIGTMAAAAGIEYESAFAGVKKTTDATAAEYRRMKEEILAMTREMPASAYEIAQVAEAAGQLGIRKEDLLAFSHTMIDLGESTNLASTEAASELAKFANITNMSADDYGRLGSTIVELGNNLATTEADIVSMAINMASAGELAGFTEPQIMAMAGAMSSVGIEAEAGGSSMSKMIKKVQVAVETGSKSLNDYARVAGMSVDEFKEAFQKDGLSAVASFIKGLNDVERNGKSATVILDEMGLTEVRLSNTLLSLANADGLLLDAVEMANNAWEENIALTKEASTRYETTESKISIMQNGFKEMGIVMYDQFNEPLREGIDLVTRLVREVTTEISGSNVIHDLAQDVVKGIPSAVHILKSAAETVDNCAGLITGAAAGIGTSLVTYRAASGIMSLASSFGTLTAAFAAGWPFLAAGGVAAAFVGIGTAVKKSAAEAKKANLDRHFGNITLSMRELQETAASIVGNEDLARIQEYMNAMSEMDGISDEITATANELNKMNWKISIGMGLSEEENEYYQGKVEAYVQSIQDYVDQNQYAINIAINTLLGDSPEKDHISEQVAQYYDKKRQEMGKLETQITEATERARADGIITPEESQEITGLQEQLTQIKNTLAEGEFDARLDSVGAKYGNQLSANSFMDMQEELHKIKEEEMAGYSEEYQTTMSAYRAMRSDGELTQEQYEQDTYSLEKGLVQRDLETESKILLLQTDKIKDAYGGDLEYVLSQLVGEADSQLGELLNDIELGVAINPSLDFLPGNIYESLEIDESTRDALNDLYEPMKSDVEMMYEIAERCRELKIEIPEEVRQGILDADKIGALAGDTDAMWRVINESAQSDEYQATIQSFVESGRYVPKALTEPIIEGQPEVDAAVRSLWMNTQNTIDLFFGKNYFDVPFNIRMKAPYAPGYIPSEQKYQNVDIGHKDGGIFDKPHVAWFAEEGPEAAIPIDGSQNAVNLWQQTGEMLGVLGRKDGFHYLSSQLMEMSASGSSMVDNSEENSSITLSPVFEIHTNGGADDVENMEKAIRKVLNGEFREMVEDVMKKTARDRERFSFSRK